MLQSAISPGSSGEGAVLLTDVHASQRSLERGYSETCTRTITSALQLVLVLVNSLRTRPTSVLFLQRLFIINRPLYSWVFFSRYKLPNLPAFAAAVPRWSPVLPGRVWCGNSATQCCLLLLQAATHPLPFCEGQTPFSYTHKSLQTGKKPFLSCSSFVGASWLKQAVTACSQRLFLNG